MFGQDKDSVETRLKRVFVEQLGCDDKELVTGADVVDDLGMDSLDGIELVMAVEQEFEMEIPDEDAPENLKTFGECLAYLQKKLAS